MKLEWIQGTTRMRLVHADQTIDEVEVNELRNSPVPTMNALLAVAERHIAAPR